MERKYKVLVIAHQLKNNIIAKSGDVVFESQLSGNAAELVKLNFIEPVDEVDVEEETNTTESELDGYTIKELITFAKDNDLDVDEKLKKYDLLASIKKQVEDKIKQ